MLLDSRTLPTLTLIEAGNVEDPRFAGPFLLCEQNDPNRAMTDDKGFFCKAIVVQGDPEKDDSVECRRSVCVRNTRRRYSCGH